MALKRYNESITTPICCCGDMPCCSSCALDGAIPCSPCCENLGPDGKILVAECLRRGCEEVKYIFGMPGATDKEVLEKCGEIAEYPYDTDLPTGCELQ